MDLNHVYRIRGFQEFRNNGFYSLYYILQIVYVFDDNKKVALYATFWLGKTKTMTSNMKLSPSSCLITFQC